MSTEQRLFKYLKSGRVHPALLLSGSSQILRYKVAKEMAKIRFCKQENSPCETCTYCRRIQKDIHPDVFTLKEEEESSLKIENVRDACFQMTLSPMEGIARICIIPECHLMTPAAANALLKGLEEPLKNRYFILLTSQPHSLLPTVLSRCLEFRFPPEPEISFLKSPIETFSSTYADCFREKNFFKLNSLIRDKDDALDFVRYLLFKIRSASLEAPPPEWTSFSPYQFLSLWEGTLELEWRLRSNANFNLLLESFLHSSVHLNGMAA